MVKKKPPLGEAINKKKRQQKKKTKKKKTKTKKTKKKKWSAFRWRRTTAGSWQSKGGANRMTQ
jgi:hypothetical protein